jgi:hypothetical protein
MSTVQRICAKKQKSLTIAQVLAVDLPQGQLWLERQGTPVAGLRTDLPTQFTWALYHAQDGAIRKLPPFLGLQDTGQRNWLDGIIFLVGQEGTDSHIVWCLWGNADSTMEMIAKEGVFDPNAMLAQRGARSRRTPEDHDRLPLIHDEALLQHLHENRFPDNVVYGKTSEDTRQEHRLPWRQLQGPLYREVEEQLLNQGLIPERIVTFPGPDFTAGRVGVGLQRSSSNGFVARIRAAMGMSRTYSPWPTSSSRTVYGSQTQAFT